MKVKVAKEAILDCLQKVQSVISTRSTIPILSNVLFKAEGDQLWLSATDLDLSVKVAAAAVVEQEGGTTLAAKRVFSIFRELPAADIELEVDDKDTAEIRSGTAYFKIHGLSEDEFPPLPQFEGTKTYTLPQRTFKEMLRHTSYAASPDTARQLLNAVLLNFKGDKLSVVATDGRRMALMEQEVEFPADAQGDLVIPLKTVDELGRTLGDEGDVKIRAAEKQVAFEFGNSLIISKLVEGTYPNFRQVIPSQCAERVTLERENMINALRRAALLVSESASSVKMSFGKNKLDILSVSPEVGEGRESIAIKYSGKPIVISFNPEFLMDPLKVLVDDEVFLELNDETSPGVVKSNTPFLYVLMPIRTT